MAVAQNTVIIDDVEYKPGEQLPQLGSIHRVFKDGGKRHYEGLAKDSDKLPLYVANNSSCFMTDTGEYYKFDESKKLWYKPDKIEQSKVTPIEVYGVLNGKIQQVSEDVEGIATPLLYKGSVSNISQLPLSPKIGWMYNISEKSIYGEAGMNVAWTGEIWDTLGPAIDMAPYLREDSEIITSLKTKTENLESANYTDRGTLADSDAFLINDGTGMKRGVLSKLSDFVLNKIADKVFAKLQTNDKTILGAINELNSKVKIDNIRYITCGEYGVLATFAVGKLLYCKFNGNAKDSQIAQTNIAQLPDIYILKDSIGAYRSALVKDGNTNIGNIQIKVDGNIDIYCPYPFLYGTVIIPIK
jgi:hypothetical protein